MIAVAESDGLHIVVGIVRDEAGRFLLGERHEPRSPKIHGKWNLLGGKIEPGELPHHAIVREIFEESGLLVRVTRACERRFERIREAGPKTLRVIEFVFECEVVGGQLCRDSPDSAINQLKYFDVAELANCDLIDGEDEILNLASNENRWLAETYAFAT